jgi:ankyrin repeat protein
MTALHFAAKTGDVELVAMIIDHGAVIDAKDDVSFIYKLFTQE